MFSLHPIFYFMSSLHTTSKMASQSPSRGKINIATRDSMQSLLHGEVIARFDPPKSMDMVPTASRATAASHEDSPLPSNVEVWVPPSRRVISPRQASPRALNPPPQSHFTDELNAV